MYRMKRKPCPKDTLANGCWCWSLVLLEWRDEKCWEGGFYSKDLRLRPVYNICYNKQNSTSHSDCARFPSKQDDFFTTVVHKFNCADSIYHWYISDNPILCMITSYHFHISKTFNKSVLQEIEFHGRSMNELIWETKKFKHLPSKTKFEYLKKNSKSKLKCLHSNIPRL